MRAFLVILLLLAGAAGASPDISLRPEPREADATLAETAPQVARALVVTPTIAARVMQSVRPETRPENLVRKNVYRTSGLAVVMPPVPGKARALCGDRTILGDRLVPIRGRIKGCGIAEPIRVHSIAGLRLSQPSVMDCRTAAALKSWIDRGVRPAVGRLGGGPAGLKVAAHYACRTRNNQAGAKISEHGKGRAIDISGVVLASGQMITVLRGWRDPHQRQVWRQLHKAACGPFGTVLGPNSDRFHQDHFHFDTARYRSGSFCR